jgi:hypothetical protein
MRVNQTTGEADSLAGKTDLQRARRVCIAPMLDWTDDLKNTSKINAG